MQCGLQRERQEQSLFGLDDDYQLPMSHRADDALDTAGICMASVDTAIAPDNRGYQMMQRMGWGGRGLGRNEDGARSLVSAFSSAREGSYTVCVHLPPSLAARCQVQCACVTVRPQDEGAPQGRARSHVLHCPTHACARCRHSGADTRWHLH